MKKHMAPFSELAFRMTLIDLLLHVILSHDQFLFEGTENVSSDYKGVVDILDLGDVG
jgi:hypothetical protein